MNAEEKQLMEYFGLSIFDVAWMQLEYCKTLIPKEVVTVDRETELRKEYEMLKEHREWWTTKLMFSKGDMRKYVELEVAEINDSIHKVNRQLYFYSKGKERETNFEEAKLYPVVGLFENYGIKLDKSGNKRFKCICPFHNETAPSLTIYEESNSWHCFGCNAGSSTIDFVMKMDKCSSLEAARKLVN